MRHGLSGIAILCCLFLTILFAPMISIETSQYSFSRTLSSAGLIEYWPTIDVSVNVSHVMGANDLALGFMMGETEWKSWCENPVLRMLAIDANFRLVRILSPRVEPCAFWNESTKTGVFNWTDVDVLVQRIFEIGAEPLICFASFYNSTPQIPTGMAIDPSTGLPYPKSYAVYATEWIKHLRTLEWPVRYYEIMNEPSAYFGWNSSDTTKLANYVAFWNTVARSMRQENPIILISHDSCTIKWVFDYWLEHGDDIDFADFHKYDAHAIGQFTDKEMFDRAEQTYFEASSWAYGVDEVRQRWLNAHGKWLPIMISESNFNSAWENGTDPKLQQMAGAVWTALVLRTAILKGVSYEIHYSFCSSASLGLAQKPSGGFGFGMVNFDNNQPWYPYYVHKMLGNNLGVGDLILETNSSSNDLRSIAWIHDGAFNILLVCKAEQPRTVYLQGVSCELRFSKIDNATPFLTPSIQEGTLSATQPLVMKGYTVMLLQLS